MSNYLPGDGVRDVYTKDSGNDDNTGQNINFAVKTLDRAASIAMALVPTPSITAPASIVDSGASLYTGPFFQPDSVQMATDFSAITLLPGNPSATTISAGSASQMTWLTVSTSSTAGDVAYSTAGKSRVSLDSRALICNGPGQIGYSADGISSDYFCQVGQVLARFDDTTCVSVFATGNQPRTLNFNELNMEGINSVGILYASTAVSPAAINASAITDTGGAGNIGIHAVSGHMSSFVNEINCETAILVESGATLDVFNAHIGDCKIIVLDGGTLNINALTFGGDPNVDIVSEGTINGNIGDYTYGNAFSNDESTTLIRGGQVTEGSTNLLIDIAEGRGHIFDYSDPDAPVNFVVDWDAFVDVPIVNVATDLFSWICIDRTGAVAQFDPDNFTFIQRRDYITLGTIVHNSGVFIVYERNAVVEQETHAQLLDLHEGLGVIKSRGLVTTPNADLTFSKTSGIVLSPGAGR